MARFKSHRIDATAAIPLRPELIEFMDPQSLGLMSCVSATLRKDVLESKAWTLMANAHLPRSAEEAALDRGKRLPPLRVRLDSAR